MIVFFADGRLGNQIFQYAFLSSFQKDNEIIVTFGFENLQEVFEINNVNNLRQNWFTQKIVKIIIKPFLDLLGKKKIIGTLFVKHDKINGYKRETVSYVQRKGLLKFIKYVGPGFFQSEAFFRDEVIRLLTIKPKYCIEAESFFADIPPQSHRVFVHIRQGDYKDHKVLGKSALLPLYYYKNQINYFIARKKDYFFIFLSDTPQNIEKEFDFIKHKKISIDNSYGTDFAIMTMCQCAILSPSSFSWWGAYFMKSRDTVFAPKYWLGFNAKIEYQSGGTPSFSKWIEI